MAAALSLVRSTAKTRGRISSELAAKRCSSAFSGRVEWPGWRISGDVFARDPDAMIWNLLVRGQWTLTVGVDRIPETIAFHVRVVTELVSCMSSSARKAFRSKRKSKASNRLFERARSFCNSRTTRAGACPELPEELREPLSRTKYSRLSMRRWRFAKPPNVPYAGYAFTPDVVPGAEIEMEHCALPTGAPKARAWRAYFCEHARVPPIGRRR